MARGVKLMFKNVLQIQYDCDLQVQNDGGGGGVFLTMLKNTLFVIKVIKVLV